jgi:hypothetical protein
MTIHAHVLYSDGVIMVGDDVTNLHGVVLCGILLSELVLLFGAIALKFDALIS